MINFKHSSAQWKLDQYTMLIVDGNFLKHITKHNIHTYTHTKQEYTLKIIY